MKGAHIVELGVAVVAAWNFLLAPPGETVSEVLRRSPPIVPFLFGLLMGHIFWNR